MLQSSPVNLYIFAIPSMIVYEMEYDLILYFFSFSCFVFFNCFEEKDACNMYDAKL